MQFKVGDKVKGLCNTLHVIKDEIYTVRKVVINEDIPMFSRIYLEERIGYYYARDFILAHSWINKRTSIRR